MLQSEYCEYLGNNPDEQSEHLQLHRVVVLVLVVVLMLK